MILDLNRIRLKDYRLILDLYRATHKFKLSGVRDREPVKVYASADRSFLAFEIVDRQAGYLNPAYTEDDIVRSPHVPACTSFRKFRFWVEDALFDTQNDDFR